MALLKNSDQLDKVETQFVLDSIESGSSVYKKMHDINIEYIRRIREDETISEDQILKEQEVMKRLIASVQKKLRNHLRSLE
ncbi:MAG: hypothetical protein ABJH98_17640 [Reichenbachiella sp.]|uniref:hypothetical protein n=1 Tax=Reichenbachiella sp. TaxID=2184521 RepID=UPI00329A33EF